MAESRLKPDLTQPPASSLRLKEEHPQIRQKGELLEAETQTEETTQTAH